jgi:MFS family permease
MYWAAGLRSFCAGASGVLLGLFLAERGFRPQAIGLVVGAGLAGGAVGTGIVALVGDRVNRVRALILCAAVTAVGLGWITAVTTPVVLMAVACLGMVNGMGRDRGPAQTLEQSALADGEPPGTRTRVMGHYALVQDAGGAAGALAAAVPDWLHRAGWSMLDAYQVVFLFLAALALVPAMCYLRLPDPLTAVRLPRAGLRPEGRRHVVHVAGLSALDSLGGGLLAGSILSYWFFRRFGMTGEELGVLFFAGRCLNGLSYLLAPVLARRIGLLRTMVFTHLPSSVLLLALPLVGSAGAAATLFLLREGLVQMDVPTRQSYLAALTEPGDRAFALGVSGVVRSLGWTAGAPLAGLVMATLGLAAPLYLGAVFKVAYDLALFGGFRAVEVPGE